MQVFHIHKNKVLQKKKLFIEKKKSFFPVGYVKIIQFYIVHTWRHMQTEYKK